MRCPLCGLRAPRRACPAVGRVICPVCCGTKRQVELRCPDTCVYLSTSRTHPPASVRRQQEQDLGVLSPALATLPEARQQLFLLSLTLIERFRGEGLEAAVDADVASAAGTLAATYETAARGVIYEHRADSVPSQRMAEGIRSVFDQLGRGRPSGFATDAAVVLRQVEDRVHTVQRLAAANPRAFLELAGRVARRLGAEDAGAQPAGGDALPASTGSPILLP